MIGGGQYCVDTLTQLRAVRSATKTIELGVLETHMKSCFNKSCAWRDEIMRDQERAEIMVPFKKYE